MSLLHGAGLNPRSHEGGKRMLLESRNVVIYGGGGSIGSAVAEAFAREGARVHLVGRTLERLESAAGRIRAIGGAAETAVVDALDADAVEAHVRAVAHDFGSPDVASNLCPHR